ncbi:MAG: P-II family nitrogen regulator [Dehalococcoidia bacterium]|nr:P-II family nitrogen regulator [Dehalococcoidia bacterium]
MKKIEAIIRPEKLEAVRAALAEVGIRGLTVTEVSGRGKQLGITLQWRAGTYQVDLLPKIKLEVVVVEGDVGQAIRTIISKARTGEKGDGKIFVLPVENAIRIRNGDDGDNAV